VSTGAAHDVEVAVVGAGVVGCAVALALVRRGIRAAMLEAEPAPALAASGTNSGILHTGFDSPPGELETEMILASAALRDPLLAVLQIPVIRCGALMRPLSEGHHDAIAVEAATARRNGVSVIEREDGALEIPGEAVTDPVRYTLALAAETQRQGGELLTRFRVEAIEREAGGITLRGEDGAAMRCGIAVNCAGLGADSVARMVGDESFSIFPRKGEFLVFDPPGSQPLDHILMPVPSARTRGVLVFPTIDGKVVAGPTAVDLEDKGDWSPRPQALEEIMPKAIAMHPPLAEAEPIATYVGLRPAGRDVNYVMGTSPACPALVNVAAIRSTGLSASLGIAQRVVGIVSSLGLRMGPERELLGGPVPDAPDPWWRRTADYRALTA
jgi:glycerol-3-phosphate dehydrogenase